MAAGKVGCLFRLDVDPEERADLAWSEDTKLQERTRQMETAIVAARKSAWNPVRGGIDKQACKVALERYGGVWGPFIGVYYLVLGGSTTLTSNIGVRRRVEPVYLRLAPHHATRRILEPRGRLFGSLPRNRLLAGPSTEVRQRLPC